MGDQMMRIRLNNGTVVERPYREAVRLLSRRLADAVPDDEHVPPVTVPLDPDPVTEVSDLVTEPITDEVTEEVTAPSNLDDDLVAMTKSELIQYAKTLGLPVYGNKPDLIGRIFDHLSTTAPAVGVSAEDEPRGTSDSSHGRA